MPTITRKRTYPLSSRLLRGCRDAAIDNARELLYEASLLLGHNHRARAYFSAVTAIEEVGRAVQAFDALGRNVTDPAVSARVVVNFEDYTKRVNAAVFPLLLYVPGRRDEVMSCINEMTEPRQGPEPALYTTIGPGSEPHGPRIVTPNSSITKAIAEKWVALGKDVFAHAEPYVYAPSKLRTRAEDDAFAMKPEALLNNKEFWNHYISCMKTGDAAFETAVAEYDRKRTARNAGLKPGEDDAR